MVLEVGERLVGGRGGTRHPTLLVNLLGSVASEISLLREVHAAEEVLACTAQVPMLPTGQPMGTIWAQSSLWQEVQQNRETVTD